MTYTSNGLCLNPGLFSTKKTQVGKKAALPGTLRCRCSVITKELKKKNKVLVSVVQVFMLVTQELFRKSHFMRTSKTSVISIDLYCVVTLSIHSQGKCQGKCFDLTNDESF